MEHELPSHTTDSQETILLDGSISVAVPSRYFTFELICNESLYYFTAKRVREALKPK